ncbi:MAG: FtsX-like permease family protein, partial [Blastocatellia bacterium]|nr:FtsX-like permease family protein [Blastocatellia bacterium]
STYQSLLVSQATYYEEYRFADVFAQLKRAPESLAREIAEIPGVAQVRARVVVDVTLDVRGLDEPAAGRLVSIPERRMPMLNDLFIRRGRYIEPERSEEIIASEAFAEANDLKVGDPLNAVVNGRWKEFRIVGIALSPEYIYEVRGGGSIFPDNRRFGVLWVGRAGVASAFDMEGGFNDVALALAPGAVEADIIARLDLLLERYGGLGAYGREDQISHRFISDEIAQNRVSGNFVPTIFLGVAAFLLHIVLSRLVRTERSQIAILKAFGYGNLTIGFHYLKLALLPVLGGVALGTAAGLYFGSQITELYTMFYRFPLLRYEAGFGLVGMAVAISAAAAGLGAMGAVRGAVSLPPAEAMRPEPPARFRAGLIERFGLSRIVSPAARMILRNLARNPVKAMLSSLGIAMAVALLVVGLYFFDAINHIIKVQFQEVQREDVTVVFNLPAPSRVRHDIYNLPGVMRAEAFRAVPARLRFAHRSHRISLLGLGQGGELRRLIDEDLNAFQLPQEGLVLSAKLADLLGVGPGDTLTIEVLEGARPTRSARVAGLVDELIGISAYMDVNALNRLMREGGTVSGAYLSVDPGLAAQLYARLKRIPAVSGVNIREAAITSFNDTIAESLAISTTVLVVFACIIAFGVVYNGARIALSERGRDLASLRVLGFTRAEISFMLLGEQAILTLAAIPLGFAIGFGISAMIPSALDSELYRMPLVISARTYVFAFSVVTAAAILSGLAVIYRLRHLDLVAVLKTRE